MGRVLDLRICLGWIFCMILALERAQDKITLWQGSLAWSRHLRRKEISFVDNAKQNMMI